MEQIGILCSELFSQFNANVKKYIAETGLSLNQAKVLLLAGVFENYLLSQKDLAKICRTDTPAMSRTLDKLEESGYITRTRKNEDSRCINIALSKKGVDKSHQVCDTFDNIYDNMFSELTDEEKGQLNVILKKMAEKNEILNKINNNLISDTYMEFD